MIKWLYCQHNLFHLEAVLASFRRACLHPEGEATIQHKTETWKDIQDAGNTRYHHPETEST